MIRTTALSGAILLLACSNAHAEDQPGTTQMELTFLVQVEIQRPPHDADGLRPVELSEVDLSDSRQPIVSRNLEFSGGDSINCSSEADPNGIIVCTVVCSPDSPSNTVDFFISLPNPPVYNRRVGTPGLDFYPIDPIPVNANANINNCRIALSAEHYEIDPDQSNLVRLTYFPRDRVQQAEDRVEMLSGANPKADDFNPRGFGLAFADIGRADPEQQLELFRATADLGYIARRTGNAELARRTQEAFYSGLNQTHTFLFGAYADQIELDPVYTPEALVAQYRYLEDFLSTLEPDPSRPELELQRRSLIGLTQAGQRDRTLGAEYLDSYVFALESIASEQGQPRR